MKSGRKKLDITKKKNIYGRYTNKKENAMQSSWTKSDASFLSDEARKQLRESKIVFYRKKAGTTCVKLYKGDGPDGPIQSLIIPINQLKNRLESLEKAGYTHKRYR